MTKAQHWQSIIDQWRASGLTQRQFCSNNNVKLSSLSYWLKKLRQPESEQKSSGFIPVSVLSDSANRIELHLGSAVIKCSPSQLPEILTILEQRGHLHAPA